jgi:hypothetical protein
VAGLAGGVAFALGTFVTFAQLGGSRRGEEGLLFDPDTLSEKVIGVWKQIEPLPRATRAVRGQSAISGASRLSGSANPPYARSVCGYVPENRASSTSRPKVGNTL